MNKFGHLVRSFKYIVSFYAPILVLALLFWFSRYYNKQVFWAAGIVLIGNICLAVFTQISNFIIEKYNIEGKTRDFIYQNFTDCFFRGLAGLSEMTLYTVCFAMDLSALVAGYLLLKTVSIWQDKDNFNNKKEGLHTSIMRFAIVASLLISLGASQYLKMYISN